MQRGGVPAGCSAAAIMVLFVALVPLLLAHAMLAALEKLGLNPAVAVLAAMGIFLGGLVNIPVHRITREEAVPASPINLFGLTRLVPRLVRRRSQTIIAVNVGGCVVPVAIAVYEILRVTAAGPGPLLGLAVAVGINTAVCYRLARPVEGLGITLPALVPPLVAVLSAVILTPGLAPPVAFTAGVLGPLIGADLLNLRRIGRMSTGVASIGGAGTFDGIVISGLLATLLA